MNHISFISSPPAIDVHISKKLRIIIYTNNTGAALFFLTPTVTAAMRRQRYLSRLSTLEKVDSVKQFAWMRGGKTEALMGSVNN
jgi:hypothetical protein